MRTIDSNLQTALANQQGELILRVNTWTDAADYNSNPNTPDHVWTVKAFSIEATTASAELVTENDYALSEFTVFTIERGALLSGVEYTIESGLYHVRHYTENYGKIKIEGSSYPNQKINIAAGDGTYQEVIEAFCTAIGKTAVFKNSNDLWLTYQFLPTGKALSLNKAELFENLLKQKYCILVYEESPNNLVFYNQDSYAEPDNFSITWSPELNIFCSVSQADTVSISPYGTWWSRQFVSNNTWTSVCWSPALNLFVAVARAGTNRVMTSPDGTTWTNRTAPADEWRSVCWSPELGLFCAVASGITNRVMTSPDGITWKNRVAAEANSWNAVCWSPELSLFCAVAYSGTNRVMTSPDGITWTARAAAEANQWFSVCWSPELNLFTATSISGTNRVMTSPDGTTWTARAAALSDWVSVCWSSELGLFCAVAISGANRVMTSPDGTTWTNRTAANTNDWNAVCWSPELSLFCAVAYGGIDRIMTSPDGITWTAWANNTDLDLSYLDGPASYLNREQSEVHFIWRDEIATVHTLGDTDLPQWNLGFLASTDSPPTTRQDAYYKIYLKKAPVRLDITDGDKIHFTPYWSIDPTKTIDAMMQITEHLDLTKSPAWYQEIKSIVLFNKTEGGALPSTIERAAAYTPLVSTGFDGNLTPSVNNLQAFAQAVDDMQLFDVIGGHGDNATIPASTTYYITPFLTGLQTTAKNYPYPVAGVLKNLYLRTPSSQPASGTLVLTLMVAGVDTALVLTIPAGSGAGVYSETSTSVSIAAGALVRIKIQNNATAASCQIGGVSLAFKGT